MKNLTDDRFEGPAAAAALAATGLEVGDRVIVEGRKARHEGMIVGQTPAALEVLVRTGTTLRVPTAARARISLVEGV